ncbi:AraC family transcriptional regulator [Actinoplanes sp. ATCC 53533]|nr:AraC family transcriptional regulator [Actinoplanes sp. ATCC 53533]
MLRELRFESAAYRWLELGTPFSIDFDQAGLRGVHIIAEGRCELVLRDGKVIALAAGDVVILPSGDSHILRSPGPPTSGPPTASPRSPSPPSSGPPTASPPASGPPAAIGGAGNRTVVVCGAFVVGEPDHPALRGMPAVIHLPGTDGRPPAWVATLVDALRAEAFDGGPGSDLVMARLSDALLIRALRQHSGSVDRPGWLAGLGDPGIAAALAAIHGDLAYPWTLPTLAATAGLSRAAFAARFTERVGRPAMRYLLSLRMQRARTLLRDERATVAAIAGRVGYGSDVAFAAAFKREVGTSPGAYRRRTTSAGS